MFISGGAGSVGSMTGQLARLLGAGRVIGSTGSRWKAEQMTAGLGYDAAVVRGAAPLAEQLATAAPDGIDVFIDNVGGEDLRAAVAAARPSARFVLLSGRCPGSWRRAAAAPPHQWKSTPTSSSSSRSR